MRAWMAIALTAAGCSFDGAAPGGGGTPTPDAMAPADTAVSADAAAADAGVVPSCTEPDPDTVLLMPFEAPTRLLDITMNGHDGTFSGMGAAPVAGPADCGEAWNFSGTNSYIEIPDSQSFDLGSGSVDFWVQVSAIPTTGIYGLFSRDELGTQGGGHLTVVMTSQFFAARLQAPGSDSLSWVCSQASPSTDWTHVAVAFGDGSDLELWINGENYRRAGNTTFSWNGSGTYTCDLSTSLGIAGNDLPFVLGATNITEFGLDPSDHLIGAIDQFRISSIRRDFEID